MIIDVRRHEKIKNILSTAGNKNITTKVQGCMAITRKNTRGGQIHNNVSAKSLDVKGHITWL